jgi:hypothetical protein
MPLIRPEGFYSKVKAKGKKVKGLYGWFKITRQGTKGRLDMITLYKDRGTDIPQIGEKLLICDQGHFFEVVQIYRIENSGHSGHEIELGGKFYPIGAKITPGPLRKDREIQALSNRDYKGDSEDSND